MKTYTIELTGEELFTLERALDGQLKEVIDVERRMAERWGAEHFRSITKNRKDIKALHDLVHKLQYGTCAADVD